MDIPFIHHSLLPLQFNGHETFVEVAYNSRVYERLNALKLFSALRDVAKEVAENGWTAPLEDEFNRIHALQNKVRRNVEKGLRKLRMGGTPWSPKLQVYRDLIMLWSCMLKKGIGLKMSNRKIRRLLHKLQPKENP